MWQSWWMGIPAPCVKFFYATWSWLTPSFEYLFGGGRNGIFTSSRIKRTLLTSALIQWSSVILSLCSCFPNVSLRKDTTFGIRSCRPWYAMINGGLCLASFIHCTKSPRSCTFDRLEDQTAMSRSQDLSIWKEKQRRCREESCQVWDLNPLRITKKNILNGHVWQRNIRIGKCPKKNRHCKSIILSPASSVESIPPRFWKCDKELGTLQKCRNCKYENETEMMWIVRFAVMPIMLQAQIATDLEHR